MPEAIAPPCVGIANEIEALEAERASLQQELAELPPSEKAFLLRAIRRINLELGQLRQQLRICQEQNPPAPRPDLSARTVVLHVNHATKQLGVAALIKNIGRGSAYGPFRIDLAATLYRGGQTSSFVRAFEVPAGVILFGEPVVAPVDRAVQREGDQTVQPATLATFPGQLPPPMFPQEYLTEDMIVPLFYRDESPSATYEFEFLVDSEQQVSESNEGNNRFFLRWWTISPGSLASATTFEIDGQSGNVAEASN
jgi:hypothetical protein